jgi:hypothetical protein
LNGSGGRDESEASDPGNSFEPNYQSLVLGQLHHLLHLPLPIDLPRAETRNQTKRVIQQTNFPPLLHRDERHQTLHLHLYPFPALSSGSTALAARPFTAEHPIPN